MRHEQVFWKCTGERTMLTFEFVLQDIENLSKEVRAQCVAHRT